MKRVLMVLLVIAVVASSWWIYSQSREPVEAQLPEGIRTAEVTRGDIEAVVSATGSVSANRSETLSFPIAGKVVEVLVEEDQVVEEGQVLAHMDIEDLELRLRQAEASLEVSEAQLARSKTTPTEEEIASARAAVESAKASLEDLQAGPSWREQQLAKLAIDQAKNSLWAAQGNRDAVKGSPVAAGGSKDQAEAQVLNAEVQVKIAELQYQQLFEKPKASAIAQAEAQIRQAEANLVKLLDLPSEEDIAVAQAQVKQAQVSVDQARKNLVDNDATLTAPFDGVLTAWDLDEGDTVAPNAPVGTLLDSEGLYIRVEIDETEIGRIATGQPAHIVLDAFPETEIEGHVRKVDLVGQSLQGIIAYGVEIEIEETDLPIRPQMTAAVDIVVETKQDVVLVPNRALRRDQNGTYVEVVENNVPTRANITIGVDDEEHTEVIEGLEPGQTVVTTRPRDNVFGGGPFGGG